MRLAQVITACVLCVVGTALFTSTKSSLLYLLAQKHQNSIKQWYAAISIVLILPEVITLLRTIWGTSFAVQGQMCKWPSWKAIFLGVFTTLLESAALTFFTLEVAPQLPGYMALPIMNVLLFLQIILEQWKKNKKIFVASDTAQPQTWVARTLQTMASAFGICVFILTSCLLVILNVTGMPQTVSLVAAVVALSVVWCQPIRSYMHSSDSPCQQTRQNISFFLNLLRIFSLTSFVIMIIPMNGDVELPEVPAFIWEGVTSLGGNHVLTSAVIINCCCGGFSYIMTRLSSYYTTTWSGILVPTVVSTTLSSVLHAYNCLDGQFWTLDLVVCPLTDGSLIVAAFVVLLWILPMLILRKRYFLPADTLFKPEHENFITYGYNGICFDQHLFLNYYPSTPIFYETTHRSNGRSRVFMCTTMYREADYEMEQLLRSLAKISKSKRLKKKNVYLEAHIFLDNGVSGLTLKEFALQLMSLVETCLAVGRSDGNILHTPYGIQISCYLPGGMPLFVHLKDPNHVKAKKRWSQVMYMNYILEHRIRVTSRVHDLDVQMMKLKKQEVRPSKNTEMILQIKSLLQNLKAQDDDSEISDRRSINSKCGSEESSDQGIETGDDMSAISAETASQKDTLKVPDDAESRSTYPPSTASSCANLLAAEYPVGKTTPTSLSKSSSQTDIEKQTEDLNDSRSNTHLSEACSYASLISVDYPTGKINPAYIPDENETIPPKWLSQFISSSKAVSHVPNISELRNSASNTCSESCGKGDKISTITTDATFVNMGEVTSEYDERTYILATDADMHFNDRSVFELVDTCNNDLRLGAACGRTHPMGKKIHPIVWFQKFEYAKDFWLIKSAQNIIGSVMCCPGCFSLYRVKALEAVLPLYSEPTMKPGDVFTKDTGEDRWMCTLMMLRGWKLCYSNFSYNGTYCPDNVDEFIKQRRRWILSDFANSLMVFKNLPQLVRSNGCFSLIYVIYLLQLFFIVFLSPGSTVIMLTVGLEMLLGCNFFIATPIVSFILIGYGFMCMRLSSQAQILLTKASIVVLGLSMSAVVVGAAVFVIRDVVTDIEEHTLQLQEHYILLTLTGSLLYAALLHPKECLLLVNGIFYIFFFPAMHMLLPVYALCNIVDQTWGTRDNQKAKIPKLLCFPKLRFKKKKKKKTQNSGDQDTTAEDSEVSSDQLKQMDVDEHSFWNNLMEKLIGKDVNLGLEKGELARGLRALRLKAVLSILFSNLAWIVGLGLFYKSSLQQGTNLSGYGLMNGILYGFSFCVQVVGMTVYKIQDSTHRLGKKIFKSNKPHWITQRTYK